MNYTSHISEEARSAIARLNGSHGGAGNFVWTKARKQRARELKRDGFGYRDIASKMNCEVGSVSGMFYRERKRALKNS